MCWPLSGGGSGSPSRSGSVCALPPRGRLASSSVTSWPASTSSSAAESPARPPPTTTTLIARARLRPRAAWRPAKASAPRRKRRSRPARSGRVSSDKGRQRSRRRRRSGGPGGRAGSDPRRGAPAPLGGDEPASDVVLLDAEPSELVLRHVDAAEGPVLGDIANDVDQLQGDAARRVP